MKKLIAIFTICLAGFVSQAKAQDRVVVTRGKTVTFKCVTVGDVLKGVACYTKDVSKDVLKGAEKIISAPFKARIYIPKAKTFRWERGYWVPDRLYQVPELKIEIPKLDIRDFKEGEMKYLPYYERTEQTGDFIALRR